MYVDSVDMMVIRNVAPARESVSVAPGDCSQDAWWPGGRCSDEEMSGIVWAALRGSP